MPAPLPRRVPRLKNPLPRILRRPVRSSSVREAGYDEPTQTLDLSFTSGAVYRYDAVPSPVYEALLQAESAGRFVNNQIRGRFRCHRIG